MKQILFAVLTCASICFSCTRERDMVVGVTNPIDSDRSGETVEVSWSEVQTALPEAAAGKLFVLNQAGDTLPCQVVTAGMGQPQSLIFQVSLSANATESFRICSSDDSVRFAPQVFGRFVPERMDDFAWENNLIGYRMYGPALQATGEISNGIDVWQKRTSKLVVDQWYKNGDYHVDHGEGLDCYKVGRTLGAGAMAPYLNDTIWLGNNYVTYKVLDNGPIRVSFELTYAPYLAGSDSVVEKRIISLDANTRFNRVTEIYDRSMPVVAGIVLREGGERIETEHYVAYWEPECGADGNTGIGMIFPEKMVSSLENCGHLLAEASVEANQPFTYYTGAGWSKAGTEDADAWFDEVDEAYVKLSNPLQVKIR